MNNALCNATIRFAEGSYVTISYVDEAVGEGDEVGFLAYLYEGEEYEYPIVLGKKIIHGGHN